MQFNTKLYIQTAHFTFPQTSPSSNFAFFSLGPSVSSASFSTVCTSSFGCKMNNILYKQYFQSLQQLHTLHSNSISGQWHSHGDSVPPPTCPKNQFWDLFKYDEKLVSGVGVGVPLCAI